MSTTLNNTKPRQPKRQQRHGAVLVAVLIGLIVASMMLATMAKSALICRKYLHLQTRQNQVNWLCESGIARATRALLDDNSYVGEVWELSAEQMGGSLPGEVTIVVARSDSNQSTVTAVARYPSDQPTAIQASLTIETNASAGSASKTQHSESAGDQ